LMRLRLAWMLSHSPRFFAMTPPAQP
jgi:hypothetical protein